MISNVHVGSHLQYGNKSSLPFNLLISWCFCNSISVCDEHKTAGSLVLTPASLFDALVQKSETKILICWISQHNSPDKDTDDKMQSSDTLGVSVEKILESKMDANLVQSLLFVMFVQPGFVMLQAPSRDGMSGLT